MSKITPQAVSLYNALIERGIKCEMEHWDGHKHVDIFIYWAKIYIEVDGLQHYTDPEQIKADFRRSYYSILEKDGYIDTFHVPNIVIEQHLNEVADALAKVARSFYEVMKEEKKNTGLFGWIRKAFLK